MRHSTEETPIERMLTARQVADFLQVSICTVRRWSDKGMLRFYRIGSRGDRRYLHEDVLQFLNKSSHDSQMGNIDHKMPIHTNPNKLSKSSKKRKQGKK